MKVTYSELKATFPEEKKSVESIYGRIVPVRKISYIFTIPLLKFNITAFQASVISMIIAVAACITLCIPSMIARTIGVILVPIWHIFDCVDGNIARYTKTSSDFGSAVDAICGYYIGSFLPLALGIAGYNSGTTFLGISPVIYIIMGALGSISEPLMRLIHQKYAFEAKCVEEKTGVYIEKGDHQYTLTGFQRFRKMADVELGVVGLPMFALWTCPFLKIYGLLACYYGIFKALSLVLITFIYLRKCKNV